MNDKKICTYTVIKEDTVGESSFFLAEDIKNNSYAYGIIERTNEDFGITNYVIECTSNKYSEIANKYYENLALSSSNLHQIIQSEPQEIIEKKDCISIHEYQSLINKVVVLDSQTLRPEYARISHQLYLAVGGFGCNPKGNGCAVFGINLYSGEHRRLDKYYLLGVIKDEKLPQWAKNSVNKIKKEKSKER